MWRCNIHVARFAEVKSMGATDIRLLRRVGQLGLEKGLVVQLPVMVWMAYAIESQACRRMTASPCHRFLHMYPPWGGRWG